MSDSESRSVDVFGIRPAAEAVSHLSKGVVDGAGAFLARICLPAAEELGLMLRDRVSNWRARNATEMALEAKRLLDERHRGEELHAHPKLVSSVLEKASWTDDEKLRHMWAGLLASSCSKDGMDHSNLMFVSILDQLAPSQALLLEFAVRKTKMFLGETGWIAPSGDSKVTLEELVQATGIVDPIRLDLELDHLRILGLLTEQSGFPANMTVADIAASSMALHFYARCQGHDGPLLEFYRHYLEQQEEQAAASQSESS